MKHYTFNEVFELDEILYKLAMYEVTKGKIHLLQEMDKLLEVQTECVNKFNYFKDLVRSGECTIQSLKDSVLYKNGPYCQTDNDIPIDNPEKLIEKMEQEETDDKQDITLFCNTIGNLLKEMSKSYYYKEQDLIMPEDDEKSRDKNDEETE